MKRTIFATGMLGLFVSQSFAWGADGHIQVADIAWTKLTPAAKARLKDILNAGEPRFRNTDVRQAWRDASTFCDYMKGKTDTIFEDIIPGMNSWFNKDIESIGSEGVRCKTWHYYDIPIRYKGAKPAVDSSNALVALNLAQKELASSKDLRMSAWWVYWINHIVGDLHQPLHCVSSHEHDADGDAGGNKFQITAPDADRNVRLHGFWDGGIGLAIKADRESGLNPNVEEVTKRWTSDATLQPSSSEVSDLNVMGWIERGAKLADTNVYHGLKPKDRPNQQYLKDQIKLCKKQAVLAGYRLAEMINRILK
jgi:hypothetical protein